jgi:hypothetical protein
MTGRHHFAARTILRRSSRERIFRVARAVWQHGAVGDGRGHPSSVSLALRPAWFSWHREPYGRGWLPTLAGVRLHYERSYGGIQV